MVPQFHFISGLPRAGSTLMAAILRQNPRFTAGMTSPVGSIFKGIIAQLSAGGEFSQSITLEQKKRLLKGVFSSYYEGVGKPVIFDTNRLWNSQLPALKELYPNSKIICLVRNTAWIMDSLERQYRSNAFENTRLYGGDAESGTVYTRVEALARSDRLVGFAYNALKEAYYSEEADKLLVLDYDVFTQMPEKILPLIYSFINEPEYQHDFNNVVYDAPEFDSQLGLSGLHRVARKVEYKTRETVLPPDLFQKYKDQSFWRQPGGSRAHVIALQKENSFGS
jgi:sulfotransferase